MIVSPKHSKEDKQALEFWERYYEDLQHTDGIVDLYEDPQDKKKRIEGLEKDHEAWFEYYFPKYYSAEPMPFHTRSTHRIMKNAEWYEVRVWSRELAKSGRTMMEVVKLALTGEVKFVIYGSATNESAKRLLKPVKLAFEKNPRILNDYGRQMNWGNWSEAQFTTLSGVMFIAVGAGNAPRGARNEEIRPDMIVMDDFDTDEDCRNPEIVQKKWDWFEQALYGARSISNPLRVIFNGNLIAKDSCIARAMERADKVTKVNIRDKDGKSTWPTKNTEVHIDRALSKISFFSAQKEYFNNPIEKGTVFNELNYNRVPLLKNCTRVLAYFDPSTSNKDKQRAKKGTSYKAGVIIGVKNLRYYVYWLRVQQTNTAGFVNWLFEADEFLAKNKVDTYKIWIENNSLQDPHYEQVIKPAVKKKAQKKGHSIPLVPDDRKKSEKFFRVEATLEPVHRNGNLVFDQRLRGTEDMKVMEDQMLSVSPTATVIDGPDALEGGVWRLQWMSRQSTGSPDIIPAGTNKKRY